MFQDDTTPQFRRAEALAAMLLVVAASCAAVPCSDLACSNAPSPEVPTTVRSNAAVDGNPDVDRTLAHFYSTQRRVLVRCRRQVFGADAARLPDPRSWREYRPDVDFGRTRAELSWLRRSWLPPGRLLDGLPVPPPAGGPFGTILVVAEIHPRLAPVEFLRTYVHEQANLLDYFLHPEGGPRLMRHYGDPGDPSGDGDTGQQFERCVESLNGFAVDRFAPDASTVLARR